MKNRILAAVVVGSALTLGLAGCSGGAFNNTGTTTQPSFGTSTYSISGWRGSATGSESVLSSSGSATVRDSAESIRAKISTVKDLGITVKAGADDRAATQAVIDKGIKDGDLKGGTVTSVSLAQGTDGPVDALAWTGKGNSVDGYATNYIRVFTKSHSVVTVLIRGDTKAHLADAEKIASSKLVLR